MEVIGGFIFFGLVFALLVWLVNALFTGGAPNVPASPQAQRQRRSNVDLSYYQGDALPYGQGHEGTPAPAPVARATGGSIFDQMRDNMIAAVKSTPFDTPDNLPPNVRAEVLQRAANAEANAAAVAKITRETLAADQVIDGKFNDAPRIPQKDSGLLEIVYKDPFKQ